MQPKTAEQAVAVRPTFLQVPIGRAVRGLVVELHGSGLDVARHGAMTGLSETLLPQGLAILRLQGATPFQLSADIPPGFAWNIDGAPLPGSTTSSNLTVDDCAWIESAIDEARGDLSLSTEPLFLSAYSGGARLAPQLFSRGRLDWTAAALVSGLRAPIDHANAYPPTVAFHGLLDAINPYSGGAGPRWDVSVVEAARRYAMGSEGDVCAELQFFDGGHSLLFRSANGAERLKLYVSETGTHAWPGSTDPDHIAALGPSCPAVNASEIITSFFVSWLTHPERRTAAVSGGVVQ